MDSTGTITGELRYLPWGETRYTSGTTPTDRRYTGQIEEPELGLYFYNARWYDPALGRFTQPDSLIPQPGSPLGWDRYAYVGNNPINRIDPSGNKYCDSKYGSDCDRLSQSVEHTAIRYGLRFDGDWSLRDEVIVLDAVESVARAFSETRGMNEKPARAFRSIYGYIRMEWNPTSSECNGGGGYTHSAHYITFASLSEPINLRTPVMAYIDARNNVVHELGHAFASLWFKKNGGYANQGPYNSIPDALKNEYGFYPSPLSARLTWRQHPGDTSSNEIYADMFVGWTFDQWDNDLVGDQRDEFMTTNMVEWLR